MKRSPRSVLPATRIPAMPYHLARLLTPLLFVVLITPTVLGDEQSAGRHWDFLHEESNAGGKAFARAIVAENVGRLYLWGTGGEQPARNVYRRYELEAAEFGPRLASPAKEAEFWQPAFPEERQGKWQADDFPPFRILGQSGPDGLHHDEGPRLQTVGGYHATNRIRFWDFEGVQRPSPIHTFNMACWDSKRSRILYFSDGCTFALNPTTNGWTDLAAENHPTTCAKVAWASMCYDASRDRVMLFGGGLATNPLGGAPTWFYECAANRWVRPKLEAEPPLRCNAALAYDAATQSIVLFGGYDQSAALNDTWVYDCRADRWEERRPKLAPPPMQQPAFAALGETGKLLVCGNDARLVRRDHAATTSAEKQTWVYHVSTNEWQAVAAELDLPGYTWLSADYSAKNRTVLLVAFGPKRRVYALSHDALAPLPAEEAAALGAPPGTVAWKYADQKESLAAAPPADAAAHQKLLASLPVNRFVDAAPPGMLVSKTWSTAVVDTDRSEILYTGGGHSGYSGNDIARYSVAENRWSLDAPPRFPPYLEGTNAGIYGWSYGVVPFSQHTYLWYAYDPQSRSMVYLARPSIADGDEVQLTADPADTFVYNSKEHGYATWIYDSAEKRMRTPSFGRRFANPWHLSVIGTPEGVYCAVDNELHHGKVDRGTGETTWRLVDDSFPKPREEIKYHYEFQPLVFDSKRNRLVQLKGDGGRVDVFARPLEESGAWAQLETTGTAAIGREAVYLPRHDTILWLGDRLFALDCATNRMAEVNVELPAGSYGHECAFVYDPTHDVCLGLIPRSFSGPMQTFLFRFDPSSAKYK